MSTTTRKSDPKFLRSYDRGMMRSAFVSLFWLIFSEQKRRDGLTLQALAKKVGSTKAELSRWFNGDPNWTINTIASLSNGLGVDLKITAVERTTNLVYTPAGLQTIAVIAPHMSVTSMLQKPTMTARPDNDDDDAPQSLTESVGGFANPPLLSAVVN